MSESQGTPQHRYPLAGLPQPDRPVGRLTDEQRAQLATAKPEDRDRILREVRQQHASRSIADAVAQGRLSQADADAVLERLSHGEDVHRVRRELRRLGVLPGRADPPPGGAAKTPAVPTTTEDQRTRP